MIGNYSVFVDEVLTPIVFGNVDQLPRLQDGDFLLNQSYLAEINAYQPINEIWFYCYRPIHGRTLSLVTTHQPIGIEFRDNLITIGNRMNNVYGLDSATAFRALPEDNSHLSVNTTHLREDLYDHVFYRSNYYHFILRHDRTNCDDYHGKKIGNWRFYIR